MGELRSLLGFLGYYRCYVKNFATKMRPLYDLLKLHDPLQNSENKNKTVSKEKKIYNKKQAIEWNGKLQ